MELEYCRTLTRAYHTAKAEAKKIQQAKDRSWTLFSSVRKMLAGKNSRSQDMVDRLGTFFNDKIEAIRAKCTSQGDSRNQ